MDTYAPPPKLSFDTHPSRYRHWTLAIDGDIARLTMKVTPFGGANSELELKSNSYDLSVDIELADAIQRLRFEHPSVKACVITSGHDKIFCAGANIYMLASSTHPFKVNFCKYTNETRLAIEDASQNSGIKFLAACNGATAGGGYELALACDEIVLIDDGSSTVSLPEVPLLGVLPGTGGLTRVVDKRKVRRDLADAFSTLAEGVKGKRAVEWGLVDAVVPRSKFADTIAQRARDLASKAPKERGSKGVPLDEIGNEYRHVSFTVDEKSRTAELVVKGPTDATLKEDSSFWPLRMARELDHALLRLRFEHENVGLVIVRTEGDKQKAHEIGELLARNDSWFIREVRLNLARTLRRMDVTARSFFAVVDEKSCFSGPLFELLLACDRSYVLDADRVDVWPGSLSAGALPGWNGLTRLQTRFLADPMKAEKVLAAAKEGPIDGATADKLGLATVFADDIDFEEELRVAVEERASLSPDALTGMEQNYRFAGPETLATKIFGRLSAWQNWIFIRPNATGERGALTMYGKPERPQFDTRRT
ncbi:MAG: 2,3-epoxybenzoyl-CoA dihydrolase [Myxococcales bacterium]|nr:2,3-epoxybenzoyl-CoA dihydrolase [Myxococcales bacterium]